MRMKFCLIAYSIFLIGGSPVLGKVSHLLVASMGDGVFLSDKSGKSKAVNQATFLPFDTKLSVRPKSGIETLAAGYQFRFGSSTAFVFEQQRIELFSGSIFVRSRKITNALNLKGPEASIRLSGAGSCLIDVEPNGGFKCVGLLGKIILTFNEKSSATILPGELVFTNLAENAFSDKLVVDLHNLFETSYLISGFSNSQSFLDSLKSVSESQKLFIGKTFDATVGSAKKSEVFEIINESETPNTPGQFSDDPSNVSYKNKGYIVSDSLPLQELLGRKPKRLSVTSDNFPSPTIPTPNRIATEESSEVNPTNRPFPSRLLRGN